MQQQYEKKDIREIDKWDEYDAKKRKLQNLGLTPSEYERAIQRLCKRLNI